MDSKPAFIKIDDKLFFNIGEERWEYLKTFSVRPDGVFISGYPRSGTTWTRQIVKLLLDGGKSDDDQRLDLTIPFMAMEFIGSPPAQKMDFNVNFETLPSPRTLKSHLPYNLVPGGQPHTTAAKYVYVARNPKDAAVSMWHHQSKMAHHPSRPWNEFIASYFGDNPIPYGNCLDHVLEWWRHRDAPNILFLCYEEMKMQPYLNVEKIVLGIRFGERLTQHRVYQLAIKILFETSDN